MKLSNKRSIFLLVFLISFSSLIFSQVQKLKTKVENEVIIIKNPKTPLFPNKKLILKKELAIGEESSVFLDIRTVRVDKDENIYVLDQKDCKIKMFDKSGKHIRDIGKRGNGPGEMMLPLVMEMISEKDIMIFDRLNLRITKFNSDGNILKTISTAKFSRSLNIIPDSLGNFFVLILNYSADGETIYELKKLDSEFNLLFNIGAIKTPLSASEIIQVISKQIYFQLTNKQNVIWGINTEYELQIVDNNGKPLRKIIKDYKPIHISEAGKKELLRRIYTSGRIPPGKKANFPRDYPPFHYFITDDQDWIYVKTYERVGDEGFYYDIFDSDGKYVSRILFKIRPIVIKKNKLYTIEEDKEGFHIVKRYNMEWKDNKH